MKKITPYAAWCTLDEYPETEGMIHVSEVAGRWVHDIREFVRVGKKYVAKVIRIDYQKNFITLSLKRVSKRDEKEKMNEFRKEERAEKLLELAAAKLGKTLDQAYEEVGFKLQEKFGSLFEAFQEAHKSKNFEKKAGISKEWAEAIIEIAKTNIREKIFEIKADFNLRLFDGNAVEKIRALLKKIEEETGGKVKYISAPHYRIEVKGKDAKRMEKRLIECLEKMEKEVKKMGGEFSYQLLKS